MRRKRERYGCSFDFSSPHSTAETTRITKDTATNSTDTLLDRLREHRFEGEADDLLVEINASIDVDVRLASVDVRGSALAHLDMPPALRHPPGGRGEDILADGLRTVEEEIRTGTFPVDRSLEDIHMNIEARLQTLVGPRRGEAPHRSITERSGGSRFAPPGSATRRHEPISCSKG
ncbi:hypothetical protein Q0F99_17705 [Rathayibacter oskolensis]|uniref:hypothetical protein n=1 Tax=Rathayibacter oskolensis TaxID=1891671 RepID=UPI00266028FF|nr:hypothetical protein [Rathayibacter oskolensis]WKK71279.1 hypothetical protein Q0F99_17705 [Rathayibacter oskolensis]